MPLLIASLLICRGPNQCFKRKNLHSSGLFEIKVFLLISYVLVRVRIARNLLLSWRIISTSRDIAKATGPLLGLRHHFSINWQMQFNITPSTNKCLQTFKELDNNVLFLNSDVVAQYFYKKYLSDSDLKYPMNLSCFNDIKEQLFSDIVDMWQKAGISILSTQKLATKLK